MAIGQTNISCGKHITGSALPGDVKMGQTFSVDGKTLETGTLNLINLLPENIKAGVTIGGVVGEYKDILSGLKSEAFKLTSSNSLNLGIGTWTVPANASERLLVILFGKGGDGKYGYKGSGAFSTWYRGGRGGDGGFSIYTFDIIPGEKIDYGNSNGRTWFKNFSYYAGNGTNGTNASAGNTGIDGNKGWGNATIPQFLLLHPANYNWQEYPGKGGECFNEYENNYSETIGKYWLIKGFYL